ncbi:uncharacterized protein LOC107428911 [Ziziphus jujuba]|uniref:Uncharacterized protein LOC107428911 n=1 Tax=Ziziphus jujuba TaxID=326968 RepID=A0A6P4AZW9_ZIZJJ|nr:uncharacterized protein LOC107428911 [Ziziphus jujuba]
MDNSLVAEDFSEWEQVQTPIPETLPANHPSWESNAVVVGNNCNVHHHCFSDVFPPPTHHNHRVSQLPHPSDLVQAPPHRPNSISPSPSSSSLSTSSGSDDDDARDCKKPWLASPLLAANEVGKRLRLRFGVISAEVLRLVSKASDYKLSPGGFWAIASIMTGAVTVAMLSLLYARLLKRWRQRVYHHDKERLVFLLRQKDEKIRELLLQVAQMNEILSARRRVPVHRIG